MNKDFSLILVLIHLCCCSMAQDWTLLSQQPLSALVEICSIDRFGNIYLGDSRGNILKFDPTGKITAQYAPTQYGKLSTLESWASLRVFLFYVDLQQYGFLDRFLKPSEFLLIPPELFGLIVLATPSSDNQLWLLDSGPFTLTKFDINFNSISISQSLNQVADTVNLKPYHLIEYQNRVYLGDETLGILIFDNLGNYLHTLGKPGIQPFFPWRDALYYLSQNQLYLISIYQKTVQVIELPDNKVTYQHALMAEDKVVLLSKEQMYIYHYKPR